MFLFTHVISLTNVWIIFLLNLSQSIVGFASCLGFFMKVLNVYIFESL